MQEVVDTGLRLRVEETGDWNEWIGKTWNWHGRDPRHIYVIEYYFEVPADMQGVPSEIPFKTVKTEYPRTSLMSLVGNVGGTLGMFVGFTFIGITEGLLKFYLYLKTWVKRFWIESKS